MTKCPGCAADPRPKHFSEDRRCAFRGGVFDHDNWNCSTMNELREIAEKSDPKWCENSNAALIPWSEKAVFIVLGWYKKRGRTEYAGILDDSLMFPLTLEKALEFIKQPNLTKEGE